MSHMVPSQFNFMPGCDLLANISAFLSSYLLTVPFVLRMQNQKQLCFRNGVVDLFLFYFTSPIYPWNTGNNNKSAFKSSAHRELESH